LADRHARHLDELSLHFKLAAEDTVRLSIRLAHANHKNKADVMVQELKPHFNGPKSFDIE
jgi:hypothetical protein